MEALDVDFSARDTRTTPMIEISVIFFDIGDTLATVNPDVTDRLELLPLPGAAEALRRLSTVGLRLGVISNTGAETSQTMRRALQGAGLYAFLEPKLLIYSSEVGLTKNSPEIFRLACARADTQDKPERCLFVGEDATERAFAASAGLRVAETPAKAVEAVTGLQKP
jgi:FMN phosphatase YigB (HAD superfamily)